MTTLDYRLAARHTGSRSADVVNLVLEKVGEASSGVVGSGSDVTTTTEYS